MSPLRIAPQFHGRLGAGADVELGVTVLEMLADGFGRDAEAVGDFSVGLWGQCVLALS
jgi:hypothetical protein